MATYHASSPPCAKRNFVSSVIVIEDELFETSNEGFTITGWSTPLVMSNDQFLIPEVVRTEEREAAMTAQE
jgi:hypothetical protein